MENKKCQRVLVKIEFKNENKIKKTNSISKNSLKWLLSIILSGFILNILRYSGGFFVNFYRDSNIKNLQDIDFFMIFVGIVNFISAFVLFIVIFKKLKQPTVQSISKAFYTIALMGISVSILLINLQQYFIAIIFLYISLIYGIFAVVQFLEKIYEWLWEPVYIIGKKRKYKVGKQIDTKKLTLVVTIVLAILGFLFATK